MQIASLKDLYIAELQELISVETQLAEALPRLAEVASHTTLKKALMQQGNDTEIQKERLIAIVHEHGADPLAHTDQAMQALLTETGKMVAMLNDTDILDAGLIASMQKVAHYEMAAFGTAAALAGQLGLREEQAMLHSSLEEERHADRILTLLAKRDVNPNAMAA